MTRLKIAFFGTPLPAREVLASLIESEHDIVAVVTKADKRRSRGSKLIPTPVKELAIEHSIPVYEPSSKVELEEIVSEIKADVGIVVAFGRILPESILEQFPHGYINVHYSLLPRWRGAAPVEHAILSGDEVTGVSIMKLDAGMDTGPTYAMRQIDIFPDTTADSLFHSMNSIAGDLLLLVLDSLATDIPIDQEGIETYAAKLEPQDFYFDAQTSVVDVDRKVRAGSLHKGAWTNINGETFRILETELPEISQPEKNIGTIDRNGLLTCADGTVKIRRILLPGKSPMDFSAWVNGVDKDLFPLHIDISH
jgi:methionyl-tRNA formyltransferase